ncbi:MAG: peptide chain release factor 1 [bacterium]
MIKEIQNIKKDYQKLKNQLEDPAIFSDAQKLKEITRQFNEVKEKYEILEKLEKVEGAIKETELTLRNEPELKLLAEEELKNLINEKDNLETKFSELLLPQDPLDKKNAILEIRAGTGGEESALFAANLFRMYSRYAERKGWQAKLINKSQTALGGFKEVIFEIKGDKVYKDLKYEAGTHRVQRIPETEKSGRVHTSAATVAVLPEAEEIDIKIETKDLRIDTFCASGHGGQSVNTTHSAVRITYLPTNLIVSCQDERSQLQNKERAMQILRARLFEQKLEKRQSEEKQKRKLMVGSGDRSEKIRTYNFPQDRVTDHRLKKSWHAIDRIMDGEIEEIIESLKQADK